MKLLAKIDKRLAELDAMLDGSGDRICWQPIPNSPQEQAYYSPADELLFGGQAGGGKGLPCYSYKWAIDNIESFTGECYNEVKHLIPSEVIDMDGKVLMWNGVWKPGSEIEVGDRIMNPDGQPQEVLQVHDRGVLPFYRVTFEDETFVDCDRDHLWGFWESRSNSRQKSCSGVKPILDTENPASWNTNYIVRARVRDTEWLYQEVSRGRRFIIPICAPLNFTQLHRGNKERAYFYGAILGDGSIGKKSNPTRLHCPDQHVINRCLSVSEKYSIYEEDSNCPTVAFRDDWVKQWVHNSGLTGKTAHEKFIPSGYLAESLEFRWNLAQGLFDTDGYAAKDKNEVSYTSVSPQLANDVANLVRSLGFLAKIFAHRGVCYTKGYEGEKRMAYTVQVQGNRKWRLFSLPRKVEQAKANESMHWVGKAIVTIERFPDTYSRCITVSNPNGLYITDGFNVTHNSDLIIGLALSQHKRSLFIRKHWTDLSAILSRIRDLTGAQGSAQIRLDDRLIELGGCKDANSKQKYRGRPHDLKAFDELSELRQEDYEFISAWNRTAEPGQRCRIVATTNPPDTNEGRWIIERWAPWLDPSHPNPAQSGELRWYLGNKEVGGPDPIDGVLPRSRTFIRSRVEDNPYLMESGYDRLLDNLPDGIREKLRYGDFGFQMDDGPQQLIPTGWIEAAQQRYKNGNYNQDVSVRTIGCDPARGGKDRTVIAIREGDRVDYFSQPGKATPDGSAVVQQILKYWTPNTPINLDVIGIGSSVIDYLKDLGYPVTPVNFAKGSFKRDRSGLLKFRNLRTEVFWNLRDLLDPHWGHTIALPPDTAVLNELTSLTYKLTHGGVMVDSKDTIRAKLRMSCDIADAIALSCYRGMSYISAF